MAQLLSVARIVNFPIDSNCYLITQRDSPECILVDPALKDASGFFQDIASKGLHLKYIILTHEHFDHISSVELLRDLSGCQVIATKDCSESITNPKKNLSLFHDQIGFACSLSDIVVQENGYQIFWANCYLKFYLTPGHSEGSLCFNINDCLFTGDTLIQNTKIITKLPGGSLEKLKISLSFLFTHFDPGTMIYPGHGPAFHLSATKIQTLIGES